MRKDKKIVVDIGMIALHTDRTVMADLHTGRIVIIALRTEHTIHHSVDALRTTVTGTTRDKHIALETGTLVSHPVEIEMIVRLPVKGAPRIGTGDQAQVKYGATDAQGLAISHATALANGDITRTKVGQQVQNVRDDQHQVERPNDVTFVTATNTWPQIVHKVHQKTK